MEIDCAHCEMRGAGCDDCVVFVLEPRNMAGFSTADPGYLGETEMQALGVLAAAGLVPLLRLSPSGLTVRPAVRAWTQRTFPDTKAS